MPNMPNKPNRNITRIETTTRGWEVRIMRRGKGHCKLFSDVPFGGKRKAMMAAREYRDQLIEELASKEISRKQRAKRKTQRNYSGVVGVRYVEETERRGENEYTYGYWEAQWSPSVGVRKKRRFSVNKYGDAEALRLAMKARRDGVAAMDD
jgi:hypothetical protein